MTLSLLLQLVIKNISECPDGDAIVLPHNAKGTKAVV